MNLYHCMIDLKNDAKAISFAKAMGDWMEHLQSTGHIGNWRLMRRKLDLASNAHRDFMLEIEVANLSELDAMFGYVSSNADQVDELYDKVHQLIATVDYGLYRPFPDPERVERAAIV